MVLTYPAYYPFLQGVNDTGVQQRVDIVNKESIRKGNDIRVRYCVYRIFVVNGFDTFHNLKCQCGLCFRVVWC